MAKRRGIPVTMLIDTSHVLNDGYSTVITVDQGRDSADIRLVNLIEPGDIVVTQDYRRRGHVAQQRARRR